MVWHDGIGASFPVWHSIEGTQAPAACTGNNWYTLCRLLAALLKDKLNIDCTLDSMHTNKILTWLLKSNHLEVVKYLCTALMDLPVSFADSVLPHLQVMSGYHTLAREDMHTFPPANDHIQGY